MQICVQKIWSTRHETWHSSVISVVQLFSSSGYQITRMARSLYHAHALSSMHILQVNPSTNTQGIFSHPHVTRIKIKSTAFSRGGQHQIVHRNSKYSPPRFLSTKTTPTNVIRKSQDLVVMESIKLCTETGVKVIVKPHLASFLAASVVERVVVETPQSE